MNIDDIARECAEKIQEECITWPDEYYSDGAQDLIKSTLQQVADDAASHMRDDCIDCINQRVSDDNDSGFAIRVINQLPLPSERNE